MVNLIKTIYVVFLLIVNLYSFDHINEYDASKIYYPEKEWKKINEPEKMGWSISKLIEAEKYSNQLNSGSVVIIENGVIVYSWGDFGKKYDLYSIRKSLLSATYGIYIDKGVINTSSTLEELRITDINKLTHNELQAKISDLLMSKSGVYHKAAYESKTKDLIRPKPGSYLPGQYFFYSNWDFNTLLSIFEQETKKSFFDVFQKEIASEIDMQSFLIQDMRYFFDNKRSIHPAYLFKMNILDLARFGLLMSMNGQWKDKQIISIDWIKESTKKYTKFVEGFPDGYGYMWWTRDETFYAKGYWQQVLLIDPKRKIVIAHLVDKNITNKRISDKQLEKLIFKILSAKN